MQLSSSENGGTSTPNVLSVDYATTAFNDLTWEQIATLSDSNEFSNYYEVGATKTFEYEGNTYTAEVIGVNTYNEGEITFMTKELLPTKYAMTASGYNTNGWPGSDLRTTLNTTIYNGLPEDLKTVITPKTLMYETSPNGSQDNIVMVSATDNLWLPTMYELAGNWMSANTFSYWVKVTEKVSQHQKIYESYLSITSTTNPALIKTLNGTANDWWLASTSLTSTDCFGSVTYSGDANTDDAMPNCAEELQGVPLCFVIKK